ncbi:MAG: serine/threonine protein kinase [Myxococcales bacterium]|nr:serine/threonine protein kinase [Myxococcales bacterium]MBP6843876.1 serine/threonine protein kinase [Kofleriaceae bacterium]
MDQRDALTRSTPGAHVDGPGAPAGEASAVDLSSPPASEPGTLGALLREVAGTSAGAGANELRPGELFGDTYRIVRRLGAGGMGVVYLARDLTLQREVAVKVHHARFGTERLYREALAMAQLAHPNVVAVHGVGQVDGRFYIAMEYVTGDNLAGWRAATPRSWRAVLDVMLGVGEGLAAAHAAGFVHRDVKPPNILVGHDGRPRVGDFGLVRVTSDGGRDGGDDDVAAGPDDAHAVAVAATLAPAGRSASGATPSPEALGRELTAIGTTLGTPAYMAPEQLAGRAVDARADQFAFCVVLYEALYGERPWPGKSVAALRDEIAATPPRPPTRAGVPAWLWPALRRGLARAPEERYPDLAALLAVLRRPPRRGRVVAAIAAALVLAAIVVALVMRSRHGRPSCDVAGAPAAAAWGPTPSSKIVANYVRLDPQRGPDAAHALSAGLDAWSARWQRAAVTSCDSIEARRWSPAISDASQACLRSTLAALRARVARATSAPPVRAEVDLPDPDACGDPARLVGGPPAPAETIVGGWRGDFGGLVMRRIGDELWGVYGHDDGTVRGRVIGDRFVGWWCEAPSRRAPGDAGDVEMQVIVDRDGVRAIAGRWRYGADGDWDDRWDLTAAPGPMPEALVARFADAATFCVHP